MKHGDQSNQSKSAKQVANARAYRRAALFTMVALVAIIPFLFNACSNQGFTIATKFKTTGALNVASSSTGNTAPKLALTPAGITSKYKSPQFHSAVWTGSKLVVFGGLILGVPTNTGYIYDPIQFTFEPISQSGAPSARYGHSAVWTGSEMILFGGATISGGSVSTLADAYSFDPNRNLWSKINLTNAPTARVNHSAALVGRKMVIYGGASRGANGWTALSDGYVFNISNRAWSKINSTGSPGPLTGHSAVSSGYAAIIFGGGKFSSGNLIATNNIFVYTPDKDTWTKITPANQGPSARMFHAAVWTDALSMAIFGGASKTTNNGKSIIAADGAPAYSFDFLSLKWTELPTQNLPSGRIGLTANWVRGSDIFGGAAFLWGGGSGLTEHQLSAVSKEKRRYGLFGPIGDFIGGQLVKGGELVGGALGGLVGYEQAGQLIGGALASAATGYAGLGPGPAGPWGAAAGVANYAMKNADSWAPPELAQALKTASDALDPVAKTYDTLNNIYQATNPGGDLKKDATDAAKSAWDTVTGQKTETKDDGAPPLNEQQLQAVNDQVQNQNTANNDNSVNTGGTANTDQPIAASNNSPEAVGTAISPTDPQPPVSDNIQDASGTAPRSQPTDTSGPGTTPDAGGPGTQDTGGGTPTQDAGGSGSFDPGGGFSGGYSSGD